MLLWEHKRQFKHKRERKVRQQERKLQLNHSQELKHHKRQQERNLLHNSLKDQAVEKLEEILEEEDNFKIKYLKGRSIGVLFL